MTVTSGSLMYFARRCSYSRASAVGVLPIATTSSTSGIETRPSGRTGTVTVSSGLRHTKISRPSPGPIRYSAEGNEEAGGAGGSSGAPPQPATARRTAAVIARKNLPRTLALLISVPAPRRLLGIGDGRCETSAPDHPGSRLAIPAWRCAIPLRRALRNVVVDSSTPLLTIFRCSKSQFRISPLPKAHRQTRRDPGAAAFY